MSSAPLCICICDKHMLICANVQRPTDNLGHMDTGPKRSLTIRLEKLSFELDLRPLVYNIGCFIHYIHSYIICEIGTTMQLESHVPVHILLLHKVGKALAFTSLRDSKVICPYY